MAATLTSPRDLTALATAIGGLPVLLCNPGSPSANAGVRYGDIILTVNGIKTPHWDAFIQARSIDKSGMKLEIFRDGVTLSVEMVFAPSRPPRAVPDQLVHLLAPHVSPRNAN